MEALDLSTLVQVDFPEDQYYKEETEKKQIVLHHTVSGGNADGVISWWKQDPLRIATAFIIAGDGTIYQIFSSKYWAHHLGIKSDFIKSLGFTDYGTRNVTLNKESVGIEVCNWGGLMKDANGYHPSYWDANLKKDVGVTKVTIPDEDVQVFDKPYRGYLYFEKYKQEQVDSLGKLVNYLCDKWNIPKTYFPTMWDVSTEAIGSEPGIWTHVSFRRDKSDQMPQPEIIDMLQNLES